MYMCAGDNKENTKTYSSSRGVPHEDDLVFICHFWLFKITFDVPPIDIKRRHAALYHVAALLCSERNEHCTVPRAQLYLLDLLCLLVNVLPGEGVVYFAPAIFSLHRPVEMGRNKVQD